VADIHDIAKTYIAAGWQVVPLVKGEKRAESSWQKRVYTPDDFKDDDGIAGKCGEPSGWRVDVDLDSPEAIQAAELLLPHTGLIHGRPGKPNSHYWFICQGIKTSQFTDVKDPLGKSSMLVEIRSTNGYTAIPPSEHPSGDVLAWVIERAALEMTEDDLFGAVRNVALAALLARHWPGHGARHSAVGHIAGFLCHAGVLDTVRVIKTAATIAGDADLEDRVNFAQATVAKFRAGEQVTGGPKLADEIGEDVVSKMRGWLKLADVDALEEMNQRHFWTRLGKDDVIGREDDEDGVVFQRVRSLYSEYAYRKVKTGEDKNGDATFAPIFPTWLEWPKRRNYRKVTFAPPPLTCHPQDYNLWKGYAIEPKPGDCSKFLDHIREVICSGNEEHYAYLLNLLALTIQQPGTPSEVAVVLRGEPGTGKGVFVRALMRLFARHAVHLDNMQHLVGQFNAALSGKIIVFADEALWAGDKKGLGALKRLITEPTVHIVRKGIDGVDEPNCIHLFVATNEERSIPAMLKERRYLALHVSSTHRVDRAYFKALSHEIDNGGLAAFLDLMLNWPVDRELAVPITDELRNQQEETMTPEMTWLMNVLDMGCYGRHAWPAEDEDRWIESKTFYDEYVAAHHHDRYLLTAMQFGKRLVDIVADKSAPHRFPGHPNSVRGWQTRTLTEARAAFDERRGSKTDWTPIEEKQSNIP
jgi:hypothetical protein